MSDLVVFATRSDVHQAVFPIVRLSIQEKIKEVVMKRAVKLLISTLSVSFAATAIAHAGELTHAEVQQQLVHAEAQGLLPSSGTDYPPSARVIARNQRIYAAQHKSCSSKATTQRGYGGSHDGRSSAQE